MDLEHRNKMLSVNFTGVMLVNTVCSASGYRPWRLYGWNRYSL